MVCMYETERESKDGGGESLNDWRIDDAHSTTIEIKERAREGIGIFFKAARRRTWRPRNRGLIQRGKKIARESSRESSRVHSETRDIFQEDCDSEGIKKLLNKWLENPLEMLLESNFWHFSSHNSSHYFEFLFGLLNRGRNKSTEKASFSQYAQADSRAVSREDSLAEILAMWIEPQPND